MVFVRNMIKILRARALKQMKSEFLSKPQTRMRYCKQTKHVFESYKDSDNQAWHPNSLLRKQCHKLTSSNPVYHSSKAKFHYLAESALIAWANKASEVMKSTGSDVSGIRSYAKEVDSKDAVADELMSEAGSAERFAQAKRTLKEKRMSKKMESPGKPPFEEP